MLQVKKIDVHIPVEFNACPLEIFENELFSSNLALTIFFQRLLMLKAEFVGEVRMQVKKTRNRRWRRKIFRRQRFYPRRRHLRFLKNIILKKRFWKKKKFRFYRVKRSFKKFKRAQFFKKKFRWVFLIKRRRQVARRRRRSYRVANIRRKLWYRKCFFRYSKKRSLLGRFGRRFQTTTIGNTAVRQRIARTKFAFKRNKRRNWKQHNYLPLLLATCNLVNESILNWSGLAKLQERKAITLDWYFRRYLKQVGMTYTRFETEWAFVNLQHIAETSEFVNCWEILYTKYFLRNFFSNRQVFFNWFAQLIMFKDPTLMIQHIVPIITEAHLKKHRYFFFLLRKIIRRIVRVVKQTYKIEGISFFFKGKLGKKGSVKKSKFFTKTGRVSFTTKDLRMNYKHFHILTITGVIGAGFYVFFNEYVYIFNIIRVVLH